MFGLSLPTPPDWVRVIESNISEILTDHAYCEQKAASNALSLIIHFPERTDLVQTLTLLAQEELSHFKAVHDLIVRRGYTLGKERKDAYVGELQKFARKDASRDVVLLDKLLVAALIEARSCERFKVLSEHLADVELATFYRSLMASEAAHYVTFIDLARKVASDEAVSLRWQEFLGYESGIITKYGTGKAVHG
jgi:tRNA-(ms[2]io[6]A)-hydroxylase